MCGILGYIGHRDASSVLLDGLRKLEYRGYDSAGVAVQSDGQFGIRRSVGKLSELQSALVKDPVHGTTGVGHTRWATHGAPSELNAHPHADAGRKIVVVHNGIIENYQALKKTLQAKGYEFRSDTDTEVVAHLVSSYWESLSKDAKRPAREAFVQAVRAALKDIEGTFALGLLCSAAPDVIVGARRDCPLIVGLGENENFLASDVPAVLGYTRQVMFLEDGDVAVLTKDGVTVQTETGEAVERPPAKIAWDPIQAEKAGYKHFMMKEIHEQPRIVEDTLMGRLDVKTGRVSLEDVGLNDEQIAKLTRVRFVACGTSWHASLVGGYLIENMTGIPCQVEIASEFRYRDPVLEPGTLVVGVSQSGETADTLAALRLAKKKGSLVLAVANVVGSTITRDAHASLLTHCGPEIGVASTKAFLGQLVAMVLLALGFARVRKTKTDAELSELGGSLAHLSQWVSQALRCEDAVAELAKKYFQSRDFLFIGRHLNYPVALEGALKLKEVSYIHAEGYPAGEMKHGPIALIDQMMPIVAIATKSKVYDKMLSNIEEAKSRGARVIAVANEGDDRVREKAEDVIEVPTVPEEFAPLVNVIPLQFLAYQIAVLRGCDVDQPRNLAKSVTVE